MCVVTSKSISQACACTLLALCLHFICFYKLKLYKLRQPLKTTMATMPRTFNLVWLFELAQVELPNQVVVEFDSASSSASCAFKLQQVLFDLLQSASKTLLKHACDVRVQLEHQCDDADLLQDLTLEDPSTNFMYSQPCVNQYVHKWQLHATESTEKAWNIVLQTPGTSSCKVQVSWHALSDAVDASAKASTVLTYIDAIHKATARTGFEAVPGDDNIEDEFTSQSKADLNKHADTLLNYYRNLDKELQADKQVTYAVLCKDVRAITYVPEALRRNVDFVLKVIKLNWCLLEYFTACQNCNDVVTAAVKICFAAFKYASPRLKNDRSVVLQAVMVEDPCGRGALQFASNFMRNDLSVVRTAVSINGLALQDASVAMRSNLHVVRVAIQSDASALQYASQNLRCDKALVLKAVCQYKQGLALQFSGPNCRNDYSVVSAAVKQDQQAICFASQDVAYQLVCEQPELLDILKNAYANVCAQPLKAQDQPPAEVQEVH